MEEIYNILSQTGLFQCIECKEIQCLLGCIQAKIVKYVKDDFIIEEGNLINDFGIILSGNARSVKWYAENQQTIITLLKKGSEIGVLIAASFERKSPVSVQAENDTTVLFVSYNSLLSRCEKNCPQHGKLLENYINIVAQKGLLLHERINCLLKPTIREKVMTYLRRLSSKNPTHTSFSIPLNRNEMAEYLNVERSALSRELSNMKEDGLIDYHKNQFTLLSMHYMSK